MKTKLLYATEVDKTKKTVRLDLLGKKSILLSAAEVEFMIQALRQARRSLCES